VTGSLVVGVMPKELRNPYFESCAEGAREAARERGFTLRWEGPEAPEAAAQAGHVTRWVAEGVPVIAVSVEDRDGLSPVLREARRRGVKVLTWDADADRDARDVTVAPASADGIAQALAFEVGRTLGGRGGVGIITSTLTAPNQNAWLERLRARLGSEFPEIRIVAVQTCDDIEERALREAEGLPTTHPDLGALVGLCSPAVPGAARALRQAGRRGVHVTGLSLPLACREHIEDGWVDSVVTWRTQDLGYLAAWSAAALAEGELAPDTLVLRAGRLGNVMIQGDEVRLGRPHIVTAGNLDQFLG
jgi:rhamnose transport system substrate-binding protein